MDNVLLGYHVVGNTGYFTVQVLQYILDHQLIKNWVLSSCEFNRQFEYGWENENLLTALFSVPSCFAESYIWETDTSVYPWKLSLKKLDKTIRPQLYIRAKKNMLSLTKSSDPTNICTRLYPYGYGEGINQLNIKAANEGVEYIEAPEEIIGKYGVIERVWIDRRYEDASSLKAAAETMLAALQEPRVEYTVNFAEIGGGENDTAEIGKGVRIVNPDDNTEEITFITGISRVYGDYTDTTLTIANTPEDIATTVADLADRQRIEMAYSQGATNIYAQTLQANADSRNGAEINFNIPSEMRIVNKVKAKIKLTSFRAYSMATKGGGGTSTTSSSGGGTSTSTAANTYISISEHCGEPVWLNNKWGDMPTHVHEMPDQPSHTHQFETPDHSHRIILEDHTHEIEPGIYFFGGANSFDLYVNGKQREHFDSSDTEIDLTDYLIGDDGRIPRGGWQSVTIVPNGLAYVCIDLFVQGFIQSRGDLTV